LAGSPDIAAPEAGSPTTPSSRQDRHRRPATPSATCAPRNRLRSNNLHMTRMCRTDQTTCFCSPGHGQRHNAFSTFWYHALPVPCATRTGRWFRSLWPDTIEVLRGPRSWSSPSIAPGSSTTAAASSGPPSPISASRNCAARRRSAGGDKKL